MIPATQTTPAPNGRSPQGEPRSTAAFLHAHGIAVEPQQLDRLLAFAIASLPRSVYAEDPRAELTPQEVAVLEEGGFDVSAERGDRDPLAETAALYAALLKTALSTKEAAARLGVDPSRVRQRLTAKTPSLYGIRVGAEWRLPRFQFSDDAGLIPGLAEVIQHLRPELHPVAVYQWLTLPNPDLYLDREETRQLSPLDWLRLGYPLAPIVEQAELL